jgi:hypothetical protein
MEIKKQKIQNITILKSNALFAVVFAMHFNAYLMVKFYGNEDIG